MFEIDSFCFFVGKYLANYAPCGQGGWLFPPLWNRANKTFCCCLLPFPQFEIFAGDPRGDGDVLSSSGQENILFGEKNRKSCLSCGKTKLLTRKHFSGIEIECFASSVISRPIAGKLVAAAAKLEGGGFPEQIGAVSHISIFGEFYFWGGRGTGL